MSPRWVEVPVRCVGTRPAAFSNVPCGAAVEEAVADDGLDVRSSLDSQESSDVKSPER